MILRKGILYLVFTVSVLFIQNVTTVQAQINSNPRGSFDVEIGGTVSSTSASQTVTNTIPVTITGFASPNASIIFLDSSSTSLATITADPDGNFTISGISLPTTSSEYCFRVVDFKRLGTSQSCTTINPSTLANITGIYLPPTIGVERAEVSEGQDAVIYGYTMPNAQVKLRLSTGELIAITADETGYYEYRNNSLEAGDYSFVASASYNSTDSLDPKNSATLKKLSPGEIAQKAKETIQKVTTDEDGGFNWWLLTLPILLALAAALFWILKRHPELLNKFVPFLIPFVHKLFSSKGLHHDKLLKQIEKETKV